MTGFKDSVRAYLASISSALPLSSSRDSIDVAKKSKGSVTTAHSAIEATTTSNEIDCRGFNSVLMWITISAAQHWTFEVVGCVISGGTFLSCYELANTGLFAQMITPEIDASRIVVFHGIPDYIKVVATEVDDGATVTVKVQPFNV